jgi:tRNA(Ile)-lysidine synthetase-like protein
VNNQSVAVAVSQVPPGRWGVAVSGGADSVAMLFLLAGRADIQPHVIHLDHQTRGGESAVDAAFVRQLADRFSFPSTISRREQIEPTLNNLPTNLSARFRALRQELFRRTVIQEKLNGVILAHHADDQAESILLRLLRGRGNSPAGLGGLKPRRMLGGILYLRPFLFIPRDDLREYLIDKKEEWREDSSNQSNCYARNRVRKWLAPRPELRDSILEMSQACTDLAEWSRAAAPFLPQRFAAIKLASLPRILARESARRWLLRQGMTPDLLTTAVRDHLCLMASDAATPARQQFPGGLVVHRRAGWVEADCARIKAV